MFKKTWFKIVLTIMAPFIIFLSTCLVLFLPQKQQLTSLQLQNMLKNFEKKIGTNNLLANNQSNFTLNQEYGDIYEFSNNFQQSQLEVNQVSTEKSLSNLGLIQAISFYNLSQEGYYNLISELHPVDIYGRYIPFKIDRTWTKAFWADDYLKIDNSGPLIGTNNRENIWDSGNFNLQMDVFEEALQDLDYAFQISENSDLYKFLAQKYGYKWTQRFNTSTDYSQMMGNSDNTMGLHTNDDFSYKTSFRIILEVPSIIDHIEISMPRYYDGISSQRGTIGIDKMTMTDVYNNDFVTTMTNEDFHTNGKNFEDNPDNVITVPYQNANSNNPEMASDSFADVWWNKFYLGSSLDTKVHTWTLDNSRDSRSNLNSKVISSDIMDGFTTRLLSINAPRGYIPLFVDSSSYLIAHDGFLNQIPQLSLNNFNLGEYASDGNFSLGTVTVKENEKYYLFFLKTTFNIYQEFNNYDENLYNYLTKPLDNFLTIPRSTNIENGLYELDSTFLSSINPIIGLMPYYNFINWDFFKLPKNPFNNENIVYARYKIDYNSSLDETYKDDYWNYINLDQEKTTKLWLDPKSIITIEFYPKDNYRVIDSITREPFKFSYNYEIPDLNNDIYSKMNDMDFPGMYNKSVLSGNEIITTKNNLSNIGLVTEADIYFRLTYKNNEKLFAPNHEYNTTISEVNFFDSSLYTIPYNITYYSFDESFVPGDNYTREQYMRMTRLWNDGDVTLKSFENDSNYTNPFSVDNDRQNPFGNYNNYVLFRNNVEVRVKFTFDVPVLLSSIRLSAGAYWTEDAPWISKITLTKDNGDKYTNDILRAARRNHPATDINGLELKNVPGHSERENISFPSAPEVDIVNYAYLFSYYGISSLTWIKENPIDFVTNGSLEKMGPITGGSIAFWAQQTNYSNMHISEMTIYDENGLPIPYKVTYSSHLPGLINDISNPEIMKQNWEVVEKDLSQRDLYYAAPMSAFLINWFEYKNEITIDKTNPIWSKTLNYTSYNTEFLSVFNFINTLLSNNGGAVGIDSWTEFKTYFTAIFSGTGATKLLNSMQKMQDKLQANDNKAYVLNFKNSNNGATFNYGDVTFNYLIVDFEKISIQDALKKTYASLQAAELSVWGGNSLTNILQDGKTNSTPLYLTGYNWQSWDKYFEVDYKNVANDIPYFDFEFVFTDNQPHTIGSISICSKGLDDLVYTPMEEKFKAPRRIDITLNAQSGQRYNAKYVKGVQDDETGQPFDLDVTTLNFNKYYLANYGKGEIQWSTSSINIDDNLGIGVLKLEDLLSRKLFAQVYDQTSNTWENIENFKIQNNEALKMRFGFYLDINETIQGIFKNGDKWIEFYWKPPIVEGKQIIAKAMPSNLPFEGINGYGTFDLSILKYSNEFDIEIIVDQGLESEKTYVNNLPFILKNGQSLTIKLIAKKGALFYNEFGEELGKTIVKSYFVENLSDPISIAFNEPLSLNFNGYDGSGSLSFDESKIPNQLNWQIRVERNKQIFTYPFQTIPNKLFNGDNVYLDILGKNGYLINNQIQVFEYVFAEVTSLEVSKNIDTPKFEDFNSVRFVNSINNLNKYIISPESTSLFSRWEENKDVNIIYNIFDDASFNAIIKNIPSINDARLVLKKGQKLEIILTPISEGIVFVGDNKTPSESLQKIVITISVDDQHIDEQTNINYLPYDESLLIQNIEIRGGNENGYLYFDSNIPEYRNFAKLVGTNFDALLYLFKEGNNSDILSNANDSQNFELGKNIFSELKNGDRIKLVITLKEGNEWIGDDISSSTKLIKDFAVAKLPIYASEELIPELNLNIDGYQEHNTLANAQTIITSGAINALIPNYDDWIARNPNVFVGVYLIRGNDEDRIRDLVMRDPASLPMFDPVTGVGFRLDPTKPIKNLKNEDEILYYVVPKNKGEILYGNQSYYIFNYHINGLKISLPTPNLIYLSENELVQNLDGLNGEAYFNEQLFRANVINDLLNDVIIELTYNGNKYTYKSITDLLRFKNFSNDMTITFKANPQPGYFWGTNLNAEYAFGITKSFTFTSIPSEFEILPIPDLPSFTTDQIVFAGADGTGFVNELTTQAPVNMDAYLSVSNEKHQQIYSWSVKDQENNFLLNQEKYHLLKNGYFVKLVFRPKLGYILPDNQNSLSTNEIEVKGLKYNVFDFGIPKQLIQGFIGFNGFGKVFVPTINPDIATLEIYYLAPNAQKWERITADDEILVNGGTVRIKLIPNHDNGYIIDYERWENDSKNPGLPKTDIFEITEKVANLNNKITDEFITSTLASDFGININLLSQLVKNILPKGYTKLEIQKMLENAYNNQFVYYLYIYNANKDLMQKISISNLLMQDGIVTLKNGYTIELFAVAKEDYLFAGAESAKSLNDWIAPLYYEYNSSLSIPDPLITNKITFYTNSTFDINNVTFYLNFQNDNLEIPPIVNKETLLEYFDFKITISGDGAEDIVLDLNSADIWDFTYSQNRIFTFKIKNLLSKNIIRLTLSIKPEYASQWMWIKKTFSNNTTIVEQKNNFSYSIDMEFAKNILTPPAINNILFIDNTNVAGKAILDANAMGLNSQYYDYTLQITRRGIVSKYIIGQDPLPSFELNDLIRIGVLIKNEYVNDYAFYDINNQKVLSQILFENILDSNFLQLAINLPDLTIEDFDFVGPSGFAKLVGHSLQNISDILLSYEIVYQNNIVKKYDKLTDLPSNLTNGMRLRIKVKPIISQGLLIDSKGQSHKEFVYDFVIQYLKLPIVTPNFNDAILFKATLENKVVIDIDWAKAFGDFLNIEHLNITMNLHQNAYPNSPVIQSSGPWKLEEFIRNNMIDELNPQKGNLLEIYLAADSGYEFTQNNTDTIQKSIVVTEIEPMDINIDNIILDTLTYETDRDVSTIARLSNEWQAMLANLLENKLIVKFEIWKDGNLLDDLSVENQLPTNLTNGQEIRMILKTINPDYWNITYQNFYYKSLTFTYSVEKLRTIINILDFPDKLNYSGFQNNISVNKPVLPPEYLNKIQVKYQISKNGDSFSEDLAIVPTNLNNGDKIKLVYQIKGEYVFYDAVHDKVFTKNVSSSYTLENLEILVSANLENKVFLIAQEKDFVLYDYQKNSTNISFEYFLDNDDVKKQSPTLPKQFDVTKGIDIHLYVKNPSTESFFDGSDELVKHYKPHIYEIVDLPEDLATKALSKNSYDENYTFNNTIISNAELFDIIITDANGNNPNTNLNNISPGSIINIKIKTKSGSFYLLNNLDLINYKIFVPFSDSIIKVDVSSLSDLTFEGVNGAGTIANITKYDIFFKDPNLRVIFKVTHLGTVTKSAVVPTNLYNDDDFGIEVVPNNSQIETIVNYPVDGFAYKVTGLVSQAAADRESYVNTALYISLAVLGSVVLIGSFISMRKMRVG